MLRALLGLGARSGSAGARDASGVELSAGDTALSERSGSSGSLSLETSRLRRRTGSLGLWPSAGLDQQLEQYAAAEAEGAAADGGPCCSDPHAADARAAAGAQRARGGPAPGGSGGEAGRGGRADADEGADAGAGAGAESDQRWSLWWDASAAAAAAEEDARSDVSVTREERCFRTWINGLGLETRCGTTLWGPEVRSGWLLLEVLDHLQPGCVPWALANRPPFGPSATGGGLPRSLQNCTLALAVAREALGLQLVSIDAADIVAGRRKPILSLVYQMMRYHALQVLEALADEEADAGPASPAAAAVPESASAGGDAESCMPRTPVCGAEPGKDIWQGAASPAGSDCGCGSDAGGGGGGGDSGGGYGGGGGPAAAPPLRGALVRSCSDAAAAARGAAARAPAARALSGPAAAAAAAPGSPHTPTAARGGRLGSSGAGAAGAGVVFCSSSTKHRRGLRVTESDVIDWANSKLAAAAPPPQPAPAGAVRRARDQGPGASGAPGRTAGGAAAGGSPDGAAADAAADAAAAAAGAAAAAWARGVKPIESFRDASLASGVAVLRVLAAVAPPGYVDSGYVTPGADSAQRESNARYALDVIRELGAGSFLLHDDITEVQPRLMLLLFSSLMAYDQRRQQQARPRA